MLWYILEDEIVGRRLENSVSFLHSKGFSPNGNFRGHFVRGKWGVFLESDRVGFNFDVFNGTIDEDDGQEILDKFKRMFSPVGLGDDVPGEVGLYRKRYELGGIIYFCEK